MTGRLWQVMASVRLTLWLLVLLAVNLLVGSLYAKLMPVFGDLNNRLFPAWLVTRSDGHSWWLFTLFGLLGLLSVNTLACTLKRMNSLWKMRGQHRPGIFLLLLAPSIMHFCFLLIIGGHALTEFTGSKQRLPAEAGEQLSIDNRQITLLDRTNEFWQNAPLRGALRQCRATLELQDGAEVERRQVAILEPIYWQGYSLHLGMAGKPGGDVLPPLAIIVKRDPGLVLILLGNIVLCLLMLWYFPQIRKFRNGG